MKYKYRPKTKEELVNAIKKEIYEVQGTKENPNWKADLNCIDTSLITDMSGLFSNKYDLGKFNGNISEWDVSNVESMYGMFSNSKFNKDISNWNVSNVKNMNWMFARAEFNQPLNNWNVSKVTNMSGMFQSSKFNQDISNWDVNNVKDMSWMFWISKFNQPLNNWNIKNVKNMYNMFKESKFNKDIGNWPKDLKSSTALKNISVSPKYPKLPDGIKYPQTMANIFNYIIDNPNSKEITKNQTIDILTKWFNNKQKEYFNKDLDKKTVKKLLTNDFLSIYKNINNKDKFLEILKENKINIDFNKDI